MAALCLPPPKQVFGPTVNRLADVMAHTTRYAFRGSSRLAFDAGVHPATISRFLHGTLNPSAILMCRIIDALEKETGFRLDVNDIIAVDGQFLTRFVCDAMFCPGCMPDAAYDEEGNLLPKFKDVHPGRWDCSRFPKGVITREENHA